MTTPPVTPQTMERLAFVRLLHQQGVEQSRLPEPLSFTCVLTFHDAIEMFLILASEHLGISVNDRTAFVPRYFDGFHPDKNPKKGVELSGRNGVKRLTDLRNGFKHANTWPGPRGIEDSRADTASFFEENTPKVFGVAYDQIDMADLVPQEQTRKLIKRAATLNRAGSRTEAMARLQQAFQEMFHQHIRPGRSSPFSFGRNLPSMMRFDSLIRAATGNSHGPTYRATEELGKHLEAIYEATTQMQASMRVIALGLDFSEYHRFQKLVPGFVYGPGEEEETEVIVRSYHALYAASDEEYEFCLRFVISAALRLAQLEALAADPSWMAPFE